MRVKFIWRKCEHMIELQDGTTLLDSALIAGIQPPYSCMEGHCGTCEALLSTGEIVRTCQTQPRSDITSVDYDKAQR